MEMEKVEHTTLEVEEGKEQKEEQSVQSARDSSFHRRLKRYAVGVHDYVYDVWNLLDVSSLALIIATQLLLVFHMHVDATTTTQLAAVGTSVLWLRVIQYLNGWEATAAYVRMTLSIISDMQPFLVIIGLLVVGNAFVLILLYPQQEQSGSDWGDGPDFLLIPPGWLQASDVVFVRTTEALFTSLNMMFFGAEPEQLAEASSPTLAAWHYIYYVSLTPLIMMNLLIALMGGSYERVNETIK